MKKIVELRTYTFFLLETKLFENIFPTRDKIVQKNSALQTQCYLVYY